MAKQVYIDDIIGGDWYYGMGVTYKSFKREFEAALASGEDVEVLINTPGGSVFEGMAMFNLIASNKEKVTTINIGIAYSMGAVLLCAGGKRKAYKNATTMIHNVSGGAYGNSKDIKSAAEMMDKIDDGLAESIMTFTGKSKEQVMSEYLDYQDHTLTAQEAFDAGILTEIIDLNSESAPVKAMSLQEAFAHFGRNAATQDSFIDKFANRITSLFEGKKDNAVIEYEPIIASPNQPLNTTEDMKVKITSGMTALVALLNVKFDENQTEQEVELSAESLEAINTALGNANTQVEQLTANLNTANESLSTAQAEVTRLKAFEPAGTVVTKDPNAAAAESGTSGEPEYPSLKGVNEKVNSI
jgi:ATP-dependent Clp protease, protease subunit